MNYGDAFSFVFQDNDWLKKLGIAAALGLLAFIVVGYIPLMGWSLEIARRVINGEDEVLPDWSNFGAYFMEGLKAFGIYLIWGAPIWILSLLTSGLGTALGLMSDGGTGEAFAVGLSIASVCVSLFSVVYGLVMAILLVGAFGILAANGSFGEALNPANAFKRVKANFGDHILAMIVALVSLSLATALGVILCGIGIVIGMAYGIALMGHLFGQVYRQTELKGVPA